MSSEETTKSNASLTLLGRRLQKNVHGTATSSRLRLPRDTPRTTRHGGGRVVQPPSVHPEHRLLKHRSQASSKAVECEARGGHVCDLLRVNASSESGSVLRRQHHPCNICTRCASAASPLHFWQGYSSECALQCNCRTGGPKRLPPRQRRRKRRSQVGPRKCGEINLSRRKTKPTVRACSRTMSVAPPYERMNSKRRSA